MRVLLSGLTIGALAVAVTAAALAAPPVQPVEPIGSTTTISPTGEALRATLSSTKARTRPVALTLALHTELICGQPGPAPIVVKLPAAATVPSAIASRSVLVRTRPAAAVVVHANAVTVTPPRHKGLLCDVVGPGAVTLHFEKSARIGNPRSPGTYSISVVRQRSTYQASIRITR